VRAHRRLPVLLLLMVCAALLLAPADSLARKKKKKGPAPRAPFRVVAIVPPRVEITRSRVLGGVPKIEDSLEAEDAIVRLLEAEMTRRGYEVIEGVFSVDALAADPELHFAISDVQSRFDEVWGQIATDSHAGDGIARGRFDLGDPALLAAGAAGVEGLVFVRGRGVSTGGGTKAATFFLSLGGAIPGSGIELRIAVVDGRTGKVVDVSGGAAAGPILKKTDKIVAKALIPAVNRLLAAAAPPPEPAAPPPPPIEAQAAPPAVAEGEPSRPPGPEPAAPEAHSPPETSGGDPPPWAVGRAGNGEVPAEPGPEGGGLRLAISRDKTSYGPDEPILVTWVLTNTTEEPLWIAETTLPLSGQNYFDVVHPNGRFVISSASGLNVAEWYSGKPPPILELAPLESLSFEVNLKDFYPEPCKGLAVENPCSLEAPGTYRVTGIYENGRKYGASEVWVGAIASETVPIDVVAE